MPAARRADFALVCLAALLAIAVDGPARGSDGSARTPAEWLDAIERETAAEKAAWDADWRDVMRGAALAMEPYDGRPEVVARFTGEKRRLYEAYRRVWDEHAAAVAERLLAGEPIDDAGQKYRFIASGTLLHRYLRGGIKQKVKENEPLSAEEQTTADYANAVEQRGQVTLAKGYQGNRLTAADVDALRDYAMFVDIRCTGDGVLPCHLGLTRSRHGGPGFRMPGETAPDFALARMEAFLDTPLYSDTNPRDPVDVLTPLAIREFLQVMCGVGTRDGRVVAKPYEIAAGEEDQYVRLSDHRGRSPVLLVFMNATDPWAWHGKIAPMFEPLKRALGDRVKIYYICTTIHDTRMPSMDFLAEPPGQTSYVHETAMEHRARICKMFYLGWPDCTIDYLLDDMAQHFRNEWMDQGGGAYIVLIDAGGKIAYADYHKDIPPHWGPAAVNFPYEFLTIRMNHLENRLAAFFAAGGRYDKKIETEHPPWRLSPKCDRTALDGKVRNGEWMPAVVTAVNDDGRQVTIVRTLPPKQQMKGIQFWDEAGKRAVPFDPIVKSRLDTVRRWLADSRKTPSYELTIGPTTDVFINGRSQPAAKLHVGDPVGVYFAAGEDADETIEPQQVRAYRFR